MYNYLESKGMWRPGRPPQANPATAEQRAEPGFQDLQMQTDAIRGHRDISGNYGHWKNGYGDELLVIGNDLYLISSKPNNAPPKHILLTPAIHDELVFQRDYASIRQIVGSHGPAREMYNYLESKGMWRPGRPPQANPGRWGAQVPLGRGFQYHIYIHPTTQMKLSMGKAGRDEAKKHGDTGSIPRNLPLLKKLLGKKGYAMYGVHKKTGTKEPYNIKLPAKLFTAITLDASQSPSGKPIRTIMPFKQKSQKKTSQIHKAWQQFLEVYGYPIVDSRRGDPVAYRIAKGGRGPYYEGMRLKKGRKK
jgi:hypothetical protein